MPWHEEYLSAVHASSGRSPAHTAKRYVHMSRALAFACVLLAMPAPVLAFDSGPPAQIRQVRADGIRLLARGVRASGVDPKNISVQDVEVTGNRAHFDWTAGPLHGAVQLTRLDDRWWDVSTGYHVRVGFSANDSGAPPVTHLYVRAPTAAEFAPAYPTAPGWGGADAVCYFDIAITGSKPIRFSRGSTLEVWFPFVLDDGLRYNVNYVTGDHASPMIVGTIFDNTLHFVLPAFTLYPAQPMMAEIDGDATP